MFLKSVLIDINIFSFFQVDHLLFVSEVGEKVSDVRMQLNSVLLILMCWSLRWTRKSLWILAISALQPEIVSFNENFTLIVPFLIRSSFWYFYLVRKTERPQSLFSFWILLYWYTRYRNWPLLTYLLTFTFNLGLMYIVKTISIK